MSSCDLFVDVVTLLFDDMKPISYGNPVQDVKKVLFLYLFNGFFLLTVDLRDNVLNAAAAVPASPT